MSFCETSGSAGASQLLDKDTWKRLFRSLQGCICWSEDLTIHSSTSLHGWKAANISHGTARSHGADATKPHQRLFQLTSTSNLWAFISMAWICRSYLSSLLVFAHHFFDWKQPAAVFYRRLSRPQQLTVVVFCLRCVYFSAHAGCLQLRLRSDEGHPPTHIFALAYTMHTPLQAPCARHACSTFA